MEIIVTGATGYIGRRFLVRAKERGHSVVAASRSPVPGGAAWLKFDFANSHDFALPHNAEAIIHLAADTSTSVAEDEEIRTGRHLIRIAKAADVKIVFVSSQAARQDGPTKYSRTKWRIEQEVLKAGGVVVRPGQVYGGEQRGLFGSLVQIVDQFPVLPAFIPGPKVQPIHVDDLVDGLIKVVERSDLDARILHLGAPGPVTFTRFLSALAKERARKTRFYIPVPVKLVKVAGALLSREIRQQTGLDRMQSLFELPMMETTEDLRLLGMDLRTLTDGMHRSGNGRRRRLLREGWVLIRYLLRQPPQRFTVRRYVRAMEQLNKNYEVCLRGWVLSNPWAIALLDQGAARKMETSSLGWRLHVASVLAESTIPGANRFLGPMKGRTFLWAAIIIFRAGMAEMLWRALRVLIPHRGLCRGD